MPTILIVDDDKFIRFTVRDSLSEGGYRLLEAADGDEALAQLAKERADLVILDLFMPNRNGMEALAEIRQRYPGLKVLVLSSLDAPTMAEEVLQQGAAAFIAKPFHPTEMAEAVRRLLG